MFINIVRWYVRQIRVQQVVLKFLNNISRIFRQLILTFFLFRLNLLRNFQSSWHFSISLEFYSAKQFSFTPLNLVVSGYLIITEIISQIIKSFYNLKFSNFSYFQFKETTDLKQNNFWQSNWVKYDFYFK